MKVDTNLIDYAVRKSWVQAQGCPGYTVTASYPGTACTGKAFALTEAAARHEARNDLIGKLTRKRKGWAAR